MDWRKHSLQTLYLVKARVTLTQKKRLRTTCCPQVIRLWYCRATASSTSNTKQARTIQSKSCTKKVQSETVTPTAALSEQLKPSKDRSVRSRTTQSDRLVRRLVLTQLSLEMACTSRSMDFDDVPHWQWRYDGTPTHPKQTIQSTDRGVRWANLVQTAQDCKTTAETRCELDGRLNTRTGEHNVSNNAAVVTWRSIRRRNKEERWNCERLLSILGNPWSLQEDVWSRPCCTSQIHSDGEPGSQGWTDSNETQKRRVRQTYSHHEEDGIWI